VNRKGKTPSRGESATGARPRVAAPRGARSRELRIIGGRWRGRRLRFPAGADIRPTPDRVRETLFNWLAPRIAGSRCLDLFAGSGALGLEALSRGAAEVVFIERDPDAARAIEQVLETWGASTQARVERADARRFLQEPCRAPFDIVFLDPPFDSALLPDVAHGLEAGGWLAPDARIYLEHASREAPPPLPERWKAVKTGHAGEVGYDLYA
jgi:16S rRNA (guanine966-N2)-methyltransferase